MVERAPIGKIPKQTRMIYFKVVITILAFREGKAADYMSYHKEPNFTIMFGQCYVRCILWLEQNLLNISLKE